MSLSALTPTTGSDSRYECHLGLLRRRACRVRRFGCGQSRCDPQHRPGRISLWAVSFGVFVRNWRLDLGVLERLAEVLVVDAETARAYALIRRELKEAGKPIPDNDLWIAALVRQHALPLLSNDTHFDYVKGLTRTGW